MKEAFLHYLWQSQRIDPIGLKTTEGSPISIIKFGQLNTHAGPDFQNARIIIDGMQWNGHIEMHLKSSLWYQHAHDLDPAYENVILHVVLEDDFPVKRKGGALIPTLEIRDRIPSGLIRNYQRLMAQKAWIPCQSNFRSVKEIIIQATLDHQVINRLERKTKDVAEKLVANKSDWEKTFYELLARNFGLKVNATPFYMLAKSISLKILLRHRNKLQELEALLFGQAGMLEKEFSDAYPKKLKQQYQVFKNKYNLEPISLTTWKCLRLRPPNFPTIRIAQLARLFFQSNHLFSKILAIKNTKEIVHMFDLEISQYWKTHYQFDKKSKPANKKLGKTTIHLFIINTIVPFLFLYGKCKGLVKYQELAMKLLEELPAENNSIISGWKKMGVTVDDAQRSQALIELKTKACDRKKCLRCQIGHVILSKKAQSKTIKL